MKVQDLTVLQRKFLESYFVSLFEGDPDFIDASEEEYLAELSTLDFGDGFHSGASQLRVARNLKERGLLARADVIRQKDTGENNLVVEFNEKTARLMFELVQEAKKNGALRREDYVVAPNNRR